MKKILDKIGHSGIALGATLILSLLFFFLPVTEKLELSTYDWRLKTLRGSRLNDSINLLMIDQDSLDNIGAWPWPRDKYVEIMDILKTKSPPMIMAYDIMFQESKPEDEKLAESIKNAGFEVILAQNFKRKSLIESELVPVVEPIRSAATAVGTIDVNIEDPDKLIRRTGLAQKNQGKIYPSLDLVTYALMKNVHPDKIVYGDKKITVGDTVIPTDENYVILIDYYIPKGDTRQTFPRLGVYKFMELSARKTVPYKDKALYLGAGAIGMMDDYQVPNQDKMYGVVIHANVLNTLLNGSFIKPTVPLTNLIIVVILAVVFGLGFSRSANVKVLAAGSIGIFVVYTGINFYLFKTGLWLYWVQPAFAIVFGSLVISTLQFFRTHQLFGQFVAKEVVDQMVASDKFSEMGGVEKEVSILFSDIRGYTTLSEKISPSEVMNMLNEYHSEMVKIFHNHYGRVFDYQGDAQMVVFGAPIEREDHALCACRAALDMEIALQKLRNRWKLQKKELFEIGVGICTGVVAVGMVGAEGAKQYSAIGDSTNVAARLQGQSKILGAPIIISPFTMKYVRGILEVKSLGEVELKGKSKPMEVFTVLGEKDSTGPNRSET